ncbi:hypothetical protein BKA66DRAFT_571714 [Pyrenochaeta sp. MPI-SDFR-AT-0127]|nr:hypothetical protein BKA66DRAFT_571714 [Pyrenochaeta sp. MPI-SDFR-AT-0127]
MLNLLVLLSSYARSPLAWLDETLCSLCLDIKLFFKYDIYDAVQDFYADCSPEDIEIYGTMAVIYPAIALYIAWRFGFRMDNFYEWLHPGWNTPISPPHDHKNIVEINKPYAARKIPMVTNAPPRVLPLPAVVKPRHPYDHFHATGESFLAHNHYNLKKNSALQYPPNWKDFFLDEEDETKHGFIRVPKPHYGYEWKYVGTSGEDDIMQPTIEEPEESQALVAISSEFNHTVEASTLIYDIVDPPSENTPPPPPAPDLLSISAPTTVQPHPQAPSSTPVQPIKVPQASPQAHDLAPTQIIVTSQPSVEEEAFQERVAFVMSFYADKSDEVKKAMQNFLLASSTEEHRAAAKAIHSLIGEARKSLELFFENGLSAQQSFPMGWNTIIMDFWGQIQPNGYTLLQIDNDIITYMDDLFQFGRYMGLPLQAINCMPPPSPQKISRSPNCTNGPQIYAKAICETNGEHYRVQLRAPRRQTPEQAVRNRLDGSRKVVGGC